MQWICFLLQTKCKKKNLVVCSPVNYMIGVITFSFYSYECKGPWTILSDIITTKQIVENKKVLRKWEMQVTRSQDKFGQVRGKGVDYNITCNKF